MLVELCASNYATLNGLVNGVDDTFQYDTKKIQNCWFGYIFTTHKLEWVHKSRTFIFLNKSLQLTTNGYL
jgi:hypothetical protein